MSMITISHMFFLYVTYDHYRLNKANITDIFIIGALAVQEKPLPPLNILF